MEAILNELIDSYRDDIISMTKELIISGVFAENEQNLSASQLMMHYWRCLAWRRRWALPGTMRICGTVQQGDTGKQIGILSHIDVVPVSADWSIRRSSYS